MTSKMTSPTVESLQKDIESMRAEIDTLKAGTSVKVKKPKVPRAPSAFNIYMKENIPKVKEANPGIAHSAAFTKTAQMWSEVKAEKEAVEKV